MTVKNEKKKSNSILENIVFSSINTALKTIFPLVTFIYSNRILGVEGIGKVNYSKAIVSYFVLIAVLGVKNYGVREAAKIRNDKDALNCLFWDLFTINAFTTVLAYLLFFIVCWRNSFDQYRFLLYISGIAILLNGFSFEWFYLSIEEYRKIAIRTLIVQAISFLMLLLLVRSKEDVGWFAFISTFSLHGCSVLNIVAIRKHVHWITGYRPQILKHLQPILWLFAFAVSVELYTVLDTTMLGLIKGDAEVGLYTSAIRINKMVIELIGAIGIAMTPRISYSVEHCDFSKIRELVLDTTNIGLMLAIPASVGVMSLRKEIVGLFAGNEFQGAIETIFIASPIIIIITFGSMLIKQVLIPLRLEKCILLSTASAAIVNFFMNLRLIPSYGRNGAAIATVCAEIIGALVSYMFVLRKTNLQGFFSMVPQFIIATLPIPFVKKIIQTVSSNEVVITLVTVIVSCVLYYFVLFMIQNPIILKFRGQIRNKLK